MLEDKLTAEELFEINSCIPTIRNCDYQRQHSKRKYRIPGMTENPALNYGMLRRWISDFVNDSENKKIHMEKTGRELRLPPGFYKRNKKQLIGMFYGMLDHYSITIEDIVGPR